MTDSVQHCLLWILFTPLLAALAIVFFFRRFERLASFISLAAAGVITVLAIRFAWQWDGRELYANIPWFTVADFSIFMGFWIDWAAVVLLLVVCVIGFLIHLFSMGYMRGDASAGRYFAGLSCFMFSMLGIVLANNLLMLFIFWELVGFSSYALIAHYKDTLEASNASKKAFIVNRVGDFGFLLGIVACYWHFGTLDFLELKALVAADSTLMLKGIALLLICGFLGKSAQFPLHVWLPDAMAGPTPVSALIHAATMVAAGIYFLVRIFFLLPEEVLTLIFYLGAVMAVFAGLCALGQRDIKKILAYSTLSQLGFMAASVGLGYPGIALFHLTTHACFKALLFLGAGSVIHAVHHEQDIYAFGGLWKKMPITSLTFTVGLLALCGATFTSGYFSKEAILEAAYTQNFNGLCILALAAFLTALYMGRLYKIAFLGQPSAKVQTAKESPWVMTFPLMILMLFSIVVGYQFLWPKAWHLRFIEELESLHTFIGEHGATTPLFFVGLLWIFGLSAAFFFYGKAGQKDRLQERLPFVYKVFSATFYIDTIYNFYVTKIQQRAVYILHFIELVFLSGMLVRGCAGALGLVGVGLRKLHVGNLNIYIYWFLLGLAFLLIFVLS